MDDYESLIRGIYWALQGFVLEEEGWIN